MEAGRDTRVAGTDTKAKSGMLIYDFGQNLQA